MLLTLVSRGYRCVSQRSSGYRRIERDLYETPEWVTRALLPHLGKVTFVWEPAAGLGKMVRVLESAGLQVLSTDISVGQDFLLAERKAVDAIVTNPPYSMAQSFIEHALELMKGGGKVAMLLRTDFDHARTRAHLFHGCEAFAKKLVLTKRIVWFGRPGAAPSFKHAWYIWDWQHCGKPIVEYHL